MSDLFQWLFAEVRYLDSVYLLFLASTMTTGFLATVGDGWGKIAGSERFEEIWKVAIFFVAEGITIWIAIDIAQPYLVVIMNGFWIWFYAVNFFTTGLYFAWFANAIDVSLEPVQIPVIICIILGTISAIVPFVI